MRRFLCTAVFMLSAAPAAAQTVVNDVEHLDFQRPEAWAMAYASAATLFLGFGAAGSVEPGTLRAGAELAAIPEIAEADTQVGFEGTKFEDLNKSPVFGRARLWVGLPRGFTLELAWTPPLTIGGVKAQDVYGLALERPLFEGGTWRAGARVFGQAAHLQGDITCPEDVAAAGLDTDRNPFGCRAPSSDDAELDYYGLELNIARNGQAFEPFAGVAITRLDTEVQVDALVFEARDRTRLFTEGTIYTLRAGFVYRPGPDWEWMIGGDYTPLKVQRPPALNEEADGFWSVRLLGRYTF